MSKGEQTLSTNLDAGIEIEENAYAGYALPMI
jgi:hypothetical protein